jgi:hypothetical protein
VDEHELDKRPGWPEEQPPGWPPDWLVWDVVIAIIIVVVIAALYLLGHLPFNRVNNNL